MSLLCSVPQFPPRVKGGQIHICLQKLSETLMIYMCKSATGTMLRYQFSVHPACLRDLTLWGLGPTSQDLDFIGQGCRLGIRICKAPWVVPMYNRGGESRLYINISSRACLATASIKEQESELQPSGRSSTGW